MGRYVTPSGVVIEMQDTAARAVGYQSADGQPEKDAEPKQAPVKRKPGRPRKTD